MCGISVIIAMSILLPESSSLGAVPAVSRNTDLKNSLQLVLTILTALQYILLSLECSIFVSHPHLSRT